MWGLFLSLYAVLHLLGSEAGFGDIRWVSGARYPTFCVPCASSFLRRWGHLLYDEGGRSGSCLFPTKKPPLLCVGCVCPFTFRFLSSLYLFTVLLGNLSGLCVKLKSSFLRSLVLTLHGCELLRAQHSD